MVRIEIEDYKDFESLLEEMGFLYSPSGYWVIELEEDDGDVTNNLKLAGIKYRIEYFSEDKCSETPLLRVRIASFLSRGREQLEDRLILHAFEYNGRSWVHQRWLCYNEDCIDYECIKDGCKDEIELGIRQGLKELKEDIVKRQHRIKVIEQTKYEVSVIVF